MRDLKGHRAVVTGASSGIGEEFARQLASLGADLVIAARRLDRLDKLAAELARDHDVAVETLKCDLSAPEQAAWLFEGAVKGGSVTMLINNAGIGPFGRFLHHPRDKHTETVQLNAVALTELSYFFAAHMLEHGKPSYIANIGSIAGFQGTTNFAVYAGTKAYVRVFSEILARELQDTNIKVTCVCPGGTHTEFSDANGQLVKESAHRLMMSSKDVVDRALSGMLTGRTFVIPGFVNKVACLLPRFLPSGLALTLAQIAMDRSASSTARCQTKR
jgi:short-subunit dehydrogenase